MVNKAKFNKKMKEMDAGFGITKEDRQKRMAVIYTIDTNRRTKSQPEPRLID